MSLGPLPSQLSAFSMIRQRLHILGADLGCRNTRPFLAIRHCGLNLKRRRAILDTRGLGSDIRSRHPSLSTPGRSTCILYLVKSKAPWRRFQDFLPSREIVTFDCNPSARRLLVVSKLAPRGY